MTIGSLQTIVSSTWKRLSQPSWIELAQSARTQRDETLSKVNPPLPPFPDPLPLNSQDLPKQMLSAREYELTQNYDAVELLETLRAKRVSSEELTCAFLRRAVVAQYAVNCVTELMWDEAIERAKYLDSLSEPIGPLHGLPISVKECHGMKGKDAHGSSVAWIGKPADPNPINDILWSAGCVFYVRTTGPQTLMQLECNNNIFGRTVNPYNRNLTCGGSSGGEGALVGIRGSVWGIGGDIGGSVRAPASNNGVYGFKPTTKRLPLKGMRHALDSHDAVVATFGPLAVSRETLNLFMKTILDSKPWRIDESLTIKPWTPVQLEAPLKVAIEWHDGVVMPHPPTTRAMRMIAEACKKAGMEVVDWEPLEHAKAWDIVCGLYFPTGIEPILAPIKASGEPLLPMAKYITYEQPNAQERTLKEYWKLCEERDAYREAYSAHWNKTADSDKEVDVIICPTTPGVAPLHDTARYWSYTSQWNLLDYPTAVFPVTFVDQEKDVQVKDHKPMSEQDKYNHKLYTPEAYAGAPVSLSVVGRRNMDEKVMASLAAIEQAMGRK